MGVQPLREELERAEGTQRVAQRMPFRSIVQARSAGSSARFSIELIDLSCTGLRISSPHSLSVNQTVFLTIPGINPMEVRVMWGRDQTYGCAFIHPLHDVVFDHIIAHYRPR